MFKESDLQTIKKLLDSAENQIRQAKSIVFSLKMNEKASLQSLSLEENIIEGVFDGENMIDQSGKKYLVPANYASKSKLVVGDTLKLTIKSDGSYLFKQIDPVEREMIVGQLEEISPNKFEVISNKKRYKVLLASVTFFKAKEGDKLTIVVPAYEESDWAAIENLIEKGE